MTKEIKRNKIWLYVIICAVLLVVTGTTFAIFTYKSTQEENLYTKTILLDTTFREYYLIDADNVEMGSQVSGKILFKKDETSGPSYVRILASLKFKEGETPNGNQQKWLDIANATLVETISKTFTDASGTPLFDDKNNNGEKDAGEKYFSYKWSQSYGGYYYLLDGEEAGEVMLEVTNSSFIYELTDAITIPIDINIPTEQMGLVLQLKMEAIQSEYIYDYLNLEGGVTDSTPTQISRKDITPVMNVAFGVQPEEKVIIRYETNGGTPIETLVFNVGQEVTLPDAKTIRQGYYFDKWCKDYTLTTGANYVAGSTFTITENKIFYAKWEEGFHIKFLFADNEGENGVNFSDYSNTFKTGEVILPLIKFGNYTLVYFQNSNVSGDIYLPETIYTSVPSVLYAAWFYIGMDSSVYTISGGRITHYSGNYHSLLIPSTVSEFADATSSVFGAGGNTILKRIILQSNITTIPNYLFKDCTALEKVINYSNITRVGSYAFAGCSSLDYLELEDVRTIGNNAFIGCPLLDLVIGDKCTFISNNALDGKSVTIKSPVFSFSGSGTIFPTSNALYRVYLTNEYFWSYYSNASFAAYKHLFRSIEKFNISVMLNDEAYSAFLAVRKGDKIILPNTYQNTYYTIAGGAGRELDREIILGDQSYEDYLDLKVNEVNYIYGYTGDYYVVSFRYAEGESQKFADAVDIETLKIKSYKGSITLPEITFDDAGSKYQIVWFETYTADTNCYYENDIVTVLKDKTFYGVWFHIGNTSSFTINGGAIKYSDTRAEQNVIFSDEFIADDTIILAGGQNKNLLRVILEEKVTNIANNAFYDGTNSYQISFVYTCGSIKTVGNSAFRNCTQLTSIDLIGVESIYNYAFMNCKSLLRVNVNEYAFTGSIGISAFNGCSSLQEILFSYVTSIGARAFLNCESLLSPVDVGGNYDPATVSISIGTYAFHNCSSISYIKLGKAVKSIGGGAFYNCKSVRMVTLDATLDSGDNFSSSTSVSETNNTYPFGNCGDNNGFVLHIYSSYVPAYMFYTRTGTTTYTRASYTTTASIFNGPKITSIEFKCENLQIGNYAFYGMQACREIIFPNTIVNVTIGSYAFSYSNGLLKVQFKNTGTTLINGYAFAYCKKLCIFEAAIAISSGSSTTYLTGCYPSTSLVIGIDATTGKKLEKSPNESYWCLVIGEQYLLIGINYFAEKIVMEGLIPTLVYEGMAQYNKNLKEITLCCSVDYNAFNNCVELESVKFSECVPGDKYIGAYAFSYCYELSSVYFDTSDVFASLYTEIREYAFYSCDKLTEFRFPESCVLIGSYAFSECKTLSEIYFNTNLITIGSSAFRACSSLRVIEMYDKVETIGSYAFYNCVRLVSIRFSQALLTIGSYAFYNCTSLGLIEEIGEDSEGNPIYSNDFIEFPASLTNSGLGTYSFQSTTNLRKIKIYKNDRYITYNSSFENNYLTEIHVYAYVFGEYLDNWTNQSHKSFVLIDPSGFSKPWTGDSYTPRGAGTETDPYLIASGRHLQWINNRCASLSVYRQFYFVSSTATDSNFIQRYFLMKCSIDLAGYNFYPAGSDPDSFIEGRVFAGVFDGAGFTVKNLKIPNADLSSIFYGGLFGVIGVGNTWTKTHIKNVTVNHIATDLQVAEFGGIVGYISKCKAGRENLTSNSLTNADILIDNCKTTGAITCTRTTIVPYYPYVSSYYLSQDLYYGGILGGTPMSEGVRRCIADLDITIRNYPGTSYVGGVVGRTAGDVSFCGNSGDLVVTSTARAVVGGITSFQQGRIGACFNTGLIRAVSSSNDSSETGGRTLAGGITGYCNATGVTIANCYNTGTINGTSNSSVSEANVGGIIGLNSTTGNRISRCYNEGSVTGRAPNYQCTVGGIAGNNYSRMDYVVSIGSVSMSSAVSNEYCGALSGYTNASASYYACRLLYTITSGRLWHNYCTRPGTIGTGYPSAMYTFGYPGYRTFNQVFGSGATYTYYDLYNYYYRQVDISDFYASTFDIMTYFSPTVWQFSLYNMPEMKWIQYATIDGVNAFVLG